jgi:hypothetical protein
LISVRGCFRFSSIEVGLADRSEWSKPSGKP